MPLYDFACSNGHEFESLVAMGQESTFCECGAAARRRHLPSRILNRVSGIWRTSIGTFTSRSEYLSATAGHEPVNLKGVRNMYKSGAPDYGTSRMKQLLGNPRKKRELWAKAGFLLRNGLIKKDPAPATATADE